MTNGKLKVSRKAFAMVMSVAMAAPMAAPAIPAFAKTTDEIADAYKDEGYHLVWNDEFDGDTLNTDDWNVELHEPGWVNAELQRYTKLEEGNIEVKDGILSIYPKAEKKEGADDLAPSADVLPSSDFSEADWGTVTPNNGGEGSVSYQGGAAVITITNSGTANSAVQIQKTGLELKQGHEYEFKMKASSTVERKTEITFIQPGVWKWFGGATMGIGTDETDLSFKFSADSDCDDVNLQLNFGLIGGSEADSSPATVTLSDIYVTDLTAQAEAAAGKEILPSNDFSEADWGTVSPNNGGDGSVAYEDGKAVITVVDPGNANSAVQIQKTALELVQGHEYQFKMKAFSTVERKTEITFIQPGVWKWFGGATMDIGTDETDLSFTFTADTDCDDVNLQLNFGLIGDSAADSSPATITLSDISVVDLSDTGSVDVKKAYNYTSGRINTQNKHDFTYGYFEAKARVPEGQGYLPAFWLMATDETNYGQWPKCGEVDIMEVKGQDTSLSYHTIHYGYDTSSHKENQVKMQKDEGAFYNDYHIFAVDWEPGSITWYVDGEKVGSTNDWHTGRDEYSKLTYPAPFDQNFYVILNLAVGGSWVGYPDEAVVDDMPNQSFDIDYVRVYQKDKAVYEAMEKEVKAPTHEVTYREADADGNFVVNGTFKEDLKPMDSTLDNFELHLEPDNKDATYTLSDNGINISQVDVGSVDYSAQLKQTGIPMYKGWEYELSYDAYADEARTMIVGVEGPDNGWKRYFNDTTVDLTTTKQHFTHTFTMEKKTDGNGSLEFMLGNQGSTATVHISNVKLIHKSGEEVIDVFEKDVAPDGNYILNSSFDQGEERLGYWDVEAVNDEDVYVTNELTPSVRTRELRAKINVPLGTSEANPVIISQDELSPFVKGTYEFSFDLYGTKAVSGGVQATVMGKTYKPEVTKEKQTFSYIINNTKDLTRAKSDIAIKFTKPGIYYLDNVAVREAAMIKNGSFNSNLAGYEKGCYETGEADFGVDSQKAGNDTAFDADIKDTGSADWNIQLKQRGIKLEKGKSYKLTYKAKATIDREISVVFQRDGASDDVWTVYSGDNKNELTSSWQNFELAFTMNDETDENVLLSIALGAFGERITDVHHVYLDDFELVEVGGSGTGSEAPYWQKTSKGWKYCKDGAFVKSGWKKIDGGEYYFKDSVAEANAYRSGYYLTADGEWNGKSKAQGWKQSAFGWRYETGNKVYLTNTWMKIDGKWYFFHKNSYMAANEFVKSWWIGKSGVQSDPVKYGWHKTSKGWWYGSKNWYAKGATYVIDGVSYNFDKAGYCTNP